ncbi:Pex2 / Pex12 amino terminal region [Fragilaria crotonensis]|nr:Pex2 / Pex12 amino terminal region [Fragilaria crotonensis]
MSFDEILNPAIPTTVGALLTEEVAMNPFSPLPSFYEMMLIEEAQRSAQKALKDGLENMAHLASQQRTHGSNTLLRKLLNRMLHFVEFLVKKYGPEVRFLITYLIERRCIAGSSATMSESIYGGVRVKVHPGNRLESMTPHDRTRLALSMALSWYVDEKMEDIFRKWTRSTATRRSQFRDFFLKMYPYLRMTQNGTVLAYQFLYLLGKSVYFHPLSHLLRIAVRRLTHDDIVSQIPDPSPSPMNRALEKWIPSIRRAAFWVLSSTAMMGWFHQLLQHIRQEEQQHQIPALTPPPPPPPPFKLDPRHRIRIPDSSGVCPLCQQPWIAPSASRSGFVFCHKCLVLYVREHKTCPLTGMPCTEQDITRIYEPQASAA